MTLSVLFTLTHVAEHACLCLQPTMSLSATRVCLVVEQMVERSVVDTGSSYFCRVRMFAVLPGSVMHPEMNASLLLYG